MLVALTAALISQPTQIDPTLPERLRPVVERAVEAELDPKRGPSNGAAILRQAMEGANSRDELSLRLRLAGIELRRLFLARDEVPPPVKMQQALSTFTRLDLTEPGLDEWREKALELNPDVADRWKEAQPLKLAVLSSGLAGPRKEIAARLAAAFQSTGTELRFVEPEQADYRVEFSVANAPRDNLAGVQGRMEIARVAEPSWKRTIAQTSVGRTPEIARDGSIEWLSRVGGRDLFFHWLAHLGMPVLIEGPMTFGGPGRASSPHDGHDHEAP